MTLEKNPTQPFLQIKFNKIGFDWKKFKKFALVTESFVIFINGEPKIKTEQVKYYQDSLFDFQLPTPVYLAMARTTLTQKVPIKTARQ